MAAGITGSASGGLSIALDIFGNHFLAETAAVGIPPHAAAAGRTFAWWQDRRGYGVPVCSAPEFP